MKPERRMYQAVMEVNVLSSEIINIVEVDVFILTEDNTKASEFFLGELALVLPESKATA